MTDHSPALPERTPADPLQPLRDMASGSKGNRPDYVGTITTAEATAILALAAFQRETITTLTRVRKELQDLVLEHAAKCEAARAALSRAEADGERLTAALKAFGRHPARCAARQSIPDRALSWDEWVAERCDCEIGEALSASGDAARSSAVRPPTDTEDQNNG